MAITDRRTGTVVDVALLTSAPSDTTAPTVAEITAGTRLETYMTPTGITTPRSANTTDISDLTSADNYSIPTTRTNGPITAEMWREFDGTDAAWAACADTTSPPSTHYLVVCRAGFSGASGAAATGDTVDTYTVQIASREQGPTDKENGQMFTATWAVQDADLDGTVG